jgi:Ca2+-binding RTX toxin-like protein
VINAATTAAINTISTGAGNDTVNISATATGGYTINAGIGDDFVNGGAGNDAINGGDGNDKLRGGAGNDALTGGLGDDTLNGGAGADTMTGGDGSDNYNIDNAGDIVIETNANIGTGGVDIVNSSINAYTLTANVETGRVLSAGAANMTGNGLANLLYAGAGDNVLDGGLGVDTASYLYAASAVTVSLAVAGSQNTLGSGSDTLIGIENLNGGNYNDTLTGNAGANVLNGDGGADTMTGGDGADTYYVNNIGDVVTETNAASTGGIDMVYSSLNAYTLTANVENGQLLSAGAANMTGNSLNNLLYAGAGDNVLDGGLGVDTVSYLYAASAVTVSLAVAGSQNTLGSGSDTLIGIEKLNGSNYNDTLTGNAGANALNGGLGADTLVGGDGSDSYTVDNAGDVVTETNAANAGGIDTVNSSLNAYTLTANVETGRVLSAGTANLTGNNLDNLLYAGTGDNVLDGGLGVDTVSYLYAASAVTANLAVAGSQNTLGSGSDTLIGIENLNGGNYNDTLAGNAGANVLNGDGGADTMTGGDGADTYYVDNIGDVVAETNAANAGGIDMVYSSLNAYTLTANVETGRVLSAGAANMTGNSLANLLYAGTGDNILDGGLGVDTVSYLYATSAVTVSLAVAGSQNTLGAGSDTLIGIENLNGSNYNDTLTGNAGANDLSGGLGADTLVGGDGSDSYTVDNVGDVVTETNAANAGGIDTVSSSLNAYTLTANVENGQLLSAGAANMTGNGLNNLLYAGAGDNVLDGGLGVDTVSYLYAASAVTVSLAVAGSQNTLGSGSDTLIGIEKLNGSNYNDTLTGNAGANDLNGSGGADTMAGGNGADYYYVDNASDVVTETNAASTGGIDTVFSYLNAYTLTANVENGRTLSAGAANMTGNSLDNLLYAGAGNNVLDGDLGVDTVSYLYAASAITVSLAVAGSQNTLGSGSDTLIGIENLTGSNYNDTLTGDAGANILLGGLGFDTLTGGGGNDIFDFNALSEMGTLSGATDVITDFVSGQDKIDLSTLDANTATAANNAFSAFIDNTASFTAAGQLMFLDGVLYGNTNADSSAEFAIQLTGVTTLAISDIIL